MPANTSGSALRGGCKGTGREMGKMQPRKGPIPGGPPDSECCGVLQVKLMPQSPGVVGCGGRRGRRQELLGTHISKYIQVKWLLANPLKKNPDWVMRGKAAPRSWRTVHRTGTGASGGLGGALIASPWRAREKRTFKTPQT